MTTEPTDQTQPAEGAASPEDLEALLDDPTLRLIVKESGLPVAACRRLRALGVGPYEAKRAVDAGIEADAIPAWVEVKRRAAREAAEAERARRDAAEAKAEAERAARAEAEAELAPWRDVFPPSDVDRRDPAELLPADPAVIRKWAELGYSLDEVLDLTKEPLTTADITEWIREALGPDAEDPGVGLGEVADLLGLDEKTVRVWRSRYDDFPTSRARQTRDLRFGLQALTTWILKPDPGQTRRRRPAPRRLRSPLLEDPRFALEVVLDGLDLPLDEVRCRAVVALADVAADHVGGPPPRRAEKILTDSYPDRSTTGDDDLEQRIARVAEGTWAKLDTTGVLRLLVEHVVARRADGLSRRELPTTEPRLAELVAALAGPLDGVDTVDPACGDGSILLAAAQRHPGALLSGVEWDPERWAVAALRLWIWGVEADLGDGPASFFDLAPDRSFGAVLVHPPVDQPLDRWLNEFLDRLDEDGRLVAVLSAVPRTRRPDKDPIVQLLQGPTDVLVPYGRPEGRGRRPKQPRPAWLQVVVSARKGEDSEHVLLPKPDESTPDVWTERAWHQRLDELAALVPAADHAGGRLPGWMDRTDIVEAIDRLVHWNIAEVYPSRDIVGAKPFRKPDPGDAKRGLSLLEKLRHLLADGPSGRSTPEVERALGVLEKRLQKSLHAEGP